MLALAASTTLAPNREGSLDDDTPGATGERDAKSGYLASKELRGGEDCLMP